MPLRRVQRFGRALVDGVPGAEVRAAAPGSRTARTSLPGGRRPERLRVAATRSAAVVRRAARGVVRPSRAAGVGSASAATRRRAPPGVAPGQRRTIATSASVVASSAPIASSLRAIARVSGADVTNYETRAGRVPHVGGPLEDLGAREPQDGPPRRPQQRVAMRVVEPRRIALVARRRRSRPRAGARASGSRPAGPRRAGSRAARRRRRARGTRPRRRSWFPGSRCGAARSRARRPRACAVRWRGPSRRGSPPRRTSRGTLPRA